MVLSVISQMPNTEQIWSLYIPFCTELLVGLFHPITHRVLKGQFGIPEEKNWDLGISPHLKLGP